MTKEEKYKTGMFKNVHQDIMEFISKHSTRLCPNGKYDNRVICSQVDLIRLVNPIYNQLQEKQKEIDKLNEMFAWYHSKIQNQLQKKQEEIDRLKEEIEEHKRKIGNKEF